MVPRTGRHVLSALLLRPGLLVGRRRPSPLGGLPAALGRRRPGVVPLLALLAALGLPASVGPLLSALLPPGVGTARPVSGLPSLLGRLRLAAVLLPAARLRRLLAALSGRPLRCGRLPLLLSPRSALPVGLPHLLALVLRGLRGPAVLALGLRRSRLRRPSVLVLRLRRGGLRRSRLRRPPVLVLRLRLRRRPVLLVVRGRGRLRHVLPMVPGDGAGAGRGGAGLGQIRPAGHADQVTGLERLLTDGTGGIAHDRQDTSPARTPAFSSIDARRSMSPRRGIPM